MPAKRQLIKRVITDQHPINISTVADETGMSLLTVCAIVNRLVDEGEVARNGEDR